jgi:eukaryotic-like serine/threonine-protein kinase
MSSDTRTLGKYRILEEIGHGGFATVYRALDTVLEREVALKVLKPGWTDDAKAVERFMREARAASRLDQPGIVTIYDVGSAESRLFIAMKLLAGQSLDQLIKGNGPLSWERTLNIVQQVTEALDYAHGKGLVHRDLKPGNIIVSEGDRAVLTDFGLVRSAEQASLSTGSTGGVLGTPEYIPPEVWEGQAATKASDIYALACVVYEMLTGKALFAAETGAAVMRKHVLVGPEFPASWPPGVPGDVATALRKALVHEPDQRYATASEFALGLRECAGMQDARRMMQEETARKAQEEQEREAARVAAETIAEKAKQEVEEQAQHAAVVAPAAVPGGDVARAEDGALSGARAKTLWGVIFAVVGVLGALIIIALLANQPAPAYTPQPTFTPIANPGSQLGIGSTRVSDKDGMTLLHVPAGEFTMGNNSGTAHEKPEHKVYLDAFWIDQTEVTNAMFKKFVDATGYRTDAEKEGSSFVFYMAEKTWGNIEGADWQHPRGPGSARQIFA